MSQTASQSAVSAEEAALHQVADVLNSEPLDASVSAALKALTAQLTEEYGARDAAGNVVINQARQKTILQNLNAVLGQMTPEQVFQWVQETKIIHQVMAGKLTWPNLGRSYSAGEKYDSRIRFACEFIEAVLTKNSQAAQIADDHGKTPLMLLQARTYGNTGRMTQLRGLFSIPKLQKYQSNRVINYINLERFLQLAKISVPTADDSSTNMLAALTQQEVKAEAKNPNIAQELMQAVFHDCGLMSSEWQDMVSGPCINLDEEETILAKLAATVQQCDAQTICQAVAESQILPKIFLSTAIIRFTGKQYYPDSLEMSLRVELVKTILTKLLAVAPQIAGLKDKEGRTPVEFYMHQMGQGKPCLYTSLGPWVFLIPGVVALSEADVLAILEHEWWKHTSEGWPNRPSSKHIAVPPSPGDKYQLKFDINGFCSHAKLIFDCFPGKAALPAAMKAVPLYRQMMYVKVGVDANNFCEEKTIGKDVWDERFKKHSLKGKLIALCDAYPLPTPPSLLQQIKNTFTGEIPPLTWFQALAKELRAAKDCDDQDPISLSWIVERYTKDKVDPNAKLMRAYLFEQATALSKTLSPVATSAVTVPAEAKSDSVTPAVRAADAVSPPIVDVTRVVSASSAAFRESAPQATTLEKSSAMAPASSLRHRIVSSSAPRCTV